MHHYNLRELIICLPLVLPPSNTSRIILLSPCTMRATPTDDRMGNWWETNSQRLCGVAIPALGYLLPEFI